MLNDNIEHMILTDTGDNPFSGSNPYTLHLASEILSARFWSVIVYDSLTHLIITAGQPWPSVHSNSGKLATNHDGSVDICFGPEPCPGMEDNWIKTLKGREWYLAFRLYGVSDPDLLLKWKPDEIKIVKLEKIEK